MRKNVLLVALLACFIFACGHDELIPEKEAEWKDISLNEKVDLNDVCMLSEDIGFVGGYPKIDTMKVVETINLEYIGLDTFICKFVNFEEFLYQEIDTFKYQESGACFFRTTDGGATWNTIKTPFKTGVKSIQFFDENVGYVLTQHEGVFKTIDGCSSWVNVLPSVIYTRQRVYSFDPYDHITFISEDVGYAYSDKGKNSYMVRTKDGGLTWEPLANTTLQNRGLFMFGMRNFQFLEDNGNCFMDAGSKILTSNDLGDTWSEIENIKQYTNSNGEFINFYNNNIGYYNDLQKNFFRTEDGGTTWSSFSIDTEYGLQWSKTALVSEDLLYGVECIYADLPLNMIFSIDYSKEEPEFRDMTSERKGIYNDIDFPTPNIGYIVGKDGLILKYKK